MCFIWNKIATVLRPSTKYLGSLKGMGISLRVELHTLLSLRSVEQQMQQRDSLFTGPDEFKFNFEWPVINDHVLIGGSTLWMTEEFNFCTTWPSEVCLHRPILFGKRTQLKKKHLCIFIPLAGLTTPSIILNRNRGRVIPGMKEFLIL